MSRFVVPIKTDFKEIPGIVSVLELFGFCVTILRSDSG
jgi:hypothetical protein